MSKSDLNKNIYRIIHDNWISRDAKPFLITSDNQYCFNEINQIVILLSDFLKSQSKEVNNCCAIYSHNTLINVVTILACAKENWMCLPLNTSLTLAQINKQLQICNPSFIATELNNGRIPHENSTEISESIFSNISSNLKLITTTNLWNISDISTPEIINEEVPFLVTTTSGSTNAPKPIVFSQKTKITRAQSAINEWNITSSDVVLNASPFHHSLGQRHLFVALIAGCSLCNIEKFTPQKWIQLGKQFSVTFSIPVTTHLYELSKYNEFWDILSRPEFKALVSSSATLSWSLKELLIQNSNGKFYEMYGASEVGTATVLHASVTKKVKSVGKVVSGVDLTILDNDMQIIPNLQVGQISIKSVCAFMGYLDKNGKLNYFDSNCDNFLPGDLGFLDEDNFLNFKGRTKDSIISGGINIYLIDIQHMAKTMPCISDAYVFGINDEKLGSVPVLAVTLSDKVDAIDQTKRSIRAFCARNLAPYQIPRHVVVLNEFSLLSTGKIDCKKLEQEALGLIAKNY